MQGDNNDNNNTLIYTPTKTMANLQENLKCPRCESVNTKFCYYNNYNLSQPRHFCKNCRRYWTKGGTLRNIPVGGGTRKNNNKRPASISNYDYANKRPAGFVQQQAPPHASEQQLRNDDQARGINIMYGYGRSHDDQMADQGGGGSGSFGNSLLVSTSTTTNTTSPGGHQFAKLLMDGLSPNFGHGDTSSSLIQNNHNNNNNVGEFRSDFIMSVMDHKSSDDQSVNEGVDNAWPHLSIYTPGSSFH